MPYFDQWGRQEDSKGPIINHWQRKGIAPMPHFDGEIPTSTPNLLQI